MQKTVESPAKARPAALLALAAAVSVVYLFACVQVLRSASDLERANRPPFDQALVERTIQTPSLHGPELCRLLADRMQYYPHDPQQVRLLYQMSIRNGPADYHNFYSYAYYLSTRNCCGQTVLASLREAIRRCPTNPDMHRIAASYFLAIQDKQTALPYIHRAIELEPSSAQQLYALLEQYGLGVQTLVQVTPGEPDAMIQLCRHLRGGGDSMQTEFKQCVLKLAALNLDATQEVSTAELAAQAGLEDIALRFGKAASQSPEMRVNAYRVLAEQAWKNQNLPDFERYSALIEKTYIDNGSPEEAAGSALSSALRYQQRNRAEATQKVLEVLNRYPRYAEAYAQMATLSQSESDQLSLYYLKKAAEIAPDQVRYQNQLANHYLKASDFKNAEAMFSAMTATSEGQEDGYLGLSACKNQEGDRYQAISILQQALDKGIRTEQLLSQLAGLYSSVGDYDKALKLAQELALMNPDHADPHVLVGEANFNLGRYHQAREEYQQALSLEPNNARARQGLSRLESLGY